MDKNTLKSSLKSAFLAASQQKEAEKQEQAIDELCDAIAGAIHLFNLSQEITVTGIVTTGSAVTQSQVAPVKANIT